MWDHVELLLNQFRDCVFEQHFSDPVHHHRVTLFKHHSFWWHWESKWGGTPWTGWLVTVERSGHTTKNNITAFKVPDKDADNIEGVAGATWARKASVLVEELPDLSGTKGKKNVADYSKKAYISKDWVQSHQCPARSLYGVPIEVNGKLWGVIVIDSRSEKLPNRDLAEKFHKMFGKTLSKTLERA